MKNPAANSTALSCRDARWKTLTCIYVQCMYAINPQMTFSAVHMPSSGSTAANAVRLAALSALLAAAVLQLRRLRRLKADLHRAEVRASRSCCFAAAASSASIQFSRQPPAVLLVHHLAHPLLAGRGSVCSRGASGGACGTGESRGRHGGLSCGAENHCAVRFPLSTRWCQQAPKRHATAHPAPVCSESSASCSYGWGS